MKLVRCYIEIRVQSVSGIDALEKVIRIDAYQDATQRRIDHVLSNFPP